MSWQERARARGLQQREQNKASQQRQHEAAAASNARFEEWRVSTFERLGREAASLLREARAPYTPGSERAPFGSSRTVATKCWMVAHLWLHRSGRWYENPSTPNGIAPGRRLRLELGPGGGTTNAGLWRWTGTSLVWPYIAPGDLDAFADFEQLVELDVTNLLGKV